MYLELSARSSGKTTRLIKQLISDVANSDLDDKFAVIIPNMRVKRYFESRLPTNSLGKVHFRTYNYIRSYIYYEIFKYERIYFDDFCGVDAFPILKNGYYTSTPTNVDNKMLKRLIDFNEGYYSIYPNNRYSSYELSKEMIDNQYTLETFHKTYKNVKNLVPEDLFKM